MQPSPLNRITQLIFPKQSMKLVLCSTQKLTRKKLTGEFQNHHLMPYARLACSDLFLPKSLGGIEAEPLAVAKAVEAVSRHNATAGWTMMVANVSSWWCARLSAQGIEEVYADGADTFMAGAFHPPMKATPVKGGYRINGRSPLTSNVHEARWTFVTAFVMNGDQINVQNGIPEIRGIVMDSKDVTILDTWYTLGMRATDSNDIEANDVFVPEHLSFPRGTFLRGQSLFSGTAL